MIAVVGATGTIGSAVMQALGEAGVEAVGFSKNHADSERRLDLADQRTWGVFPGGAEAVLVSAGISDLRTCREQPAATREVNVEGTAGFVRFVAERGSFPVVVSTSYVFDGSRPDFGPGDAVCPRCEYGKQKADLERKLEDLSQDCAVVRITKVFGKTNRLLAAWREALCKGEEIRAADDARFSPLTEDFAGGALASLLQVRRAGVFHLSGRDDLSWFEIAKSLARKCGVESPQVKCSGLLDIDPSAEFVPRYGSLKFSWPESIETPLSVLAVDRLLENICATD